MLSSRNDGQLAGQYFHHRATFMLRLLLVIGFGFCVLMTPWPQFFDFSGISPLLQPLGDILILSPFITGCMILWWTSFSVDRLIREPGYQWLTADDRKEVESSPTPTGGHWGLRSYFGFSLRNQLLVVAVPMLLILFAADLTHGYEEPIRRFAGSFWAPDVILAFIAALVFIASPLLLIRIWQTVPLPQGGLRAKLESLCQMIGLKCRDIRIWKSDGMMINAAVMGILPGTRFVLLSDALLSSMNDRQIEAVFGHEAGHVRHRHIQHFLLFAFVGWIAVAGIMELLARYVYSMGIAGKAAALAVQGAGVLATVVIWGVGFGWVSRRFERQADLFGARCVTADFDECLVPCSVHIDIAKSPESTTSANSIEEQSNVEHREKGIPLRDAAGGDRVCATGAGVFASALRRVAMLNGIPPEERSWRHSSIANRMRFLAATADDPALAIHFERTVRRIKSALLVAAIVGTVGTLLYWSIVPEPAVLRLQANFP
ncbi:MAG: M48 family metalloprotease [Planctomycetes bacterium]|nr:M48 family metalloprotease [Planctomycetota bacterium]